jgi:nucleoside-diphosphate-sugar epimerase
MAKLGFIGLGVMGSRIVMRLMGAGHQVTGYNRTKSKAQWLVNASMAWADTHRAVVEAADISEGTFKLSNLGIFTMDVFRAIVNPPQAAILAEGRIAERVVPFNGQVMIRPMIVMTLSCDHRVLDGARVAQFLDDLATHVEDPWRLLA